MTKFCVGQNLWIRTAKNIRFSNNILEAELRDSQGNWKYNKLSIHPLLFNRRLINDNGVLRYKLTRDEDAYIMNKFYPIYTGPTVPYISIDHCVMLSVNNPKYNMVRNVTLSILDKYKLPPIYIHFGYSPNNKHKSRFHNLMINPDQRNELALGMLEIFDNFVNDNATATENKWLLYFEDDVRPINISTEEDLMKLYNVPSDAELIRPYIGKNENCDLTNVNYRVSYAGGLNHAFYISLAGCKKVLHYAKKYKWKYVCDIDLYKLAKFCGGFPTGCDGWSLTACNNNNDITPKLDENEKIVMYHLDTIIFDQTSLPCV